MRVGSRLFVAAGLALAISGCAKHEDLVATGGSRSDGIVNLSYDYRSAEHPKIDLAQGEAAARDLCRAWGGSRSRAQLPGAPQALSRKLGGLFRLRALQTVDEPLRFFQCLFEGGGIDHLPPAKLGKELTVVSANVDNPMGTGCRRVEPDHDEALVGLGSLHECILRDGHAARPFLSLLRSGPVCASIGA